MQFSRRSNFTIKNVFLIFLSFFLISYLAKLGDFFSFSGLITPIVFSILFFLFFFLEKEKIKINLVDIFIVFLVFYSLLSVFFNEITTEHFMLLIQFNILAIGSYFMLRFIAFDRNDVKLLFRLIAIFFLTSIFLIYLLFPTGALINSSLRLGGDYFNPVGLAYSSLVVIGSSIGSLMIKEENFFWKGLMLLSSVLAFLVLFFSGSRGPFGIFLIILILIFLRIFFDLSAFKKLTIAMISISLITYSLINSSIEIDNSYRVLNFTINESIINRFFMYENAFNSISEAPFFGSGFSEFQHQHGYPHNIFLELFLYFGIIGLLFSYLIAISLVYLPVKIILEKNQIKVVFLIIILLMLAPKLVSTNIGMSKELLIFMSIYFTNKDYFSKESLKN